MKTLLLILFLLVQSFFAFSEDNECPGKLIDTTFVELYEGKISKHVEDSCFEQLSCDDKIVLSGIYQAVGEEKDGPKALEIIDQELSKLPAHQQNRLQTVIYAGLVKKIHENQQPTKNAPQKLEDLPNSEMLQLKMQHYLTSVEKFYETMEKIKNNPTGSYWVYSLADRQNWQGKLINLVKDIPDFEQTPLGVSLDWVQHEKQQLIQEFETHLKNNGKNSQEIEQYSSQLKDQLQNQWNDIERAIEAGDNAILGNANALKKTYQGILSGTILAATAGTAGPIVFALNGAGLYLAADSAIDLAESSIDAYKEGGTDNLYCSFARNNIDRRELKNVFYDAAIAGGAALVLGGAFNYLATIESKIGMYATVGAGTIGVTYGLNTVFNVPAKQIKLLDELALEAEKAGDKEIVSCLKMAASKILAGSAINTAALVASVYRIGEADFSKYNNPKFKSLIDDYQNPIISKSSGSSSSAQTTPRQKYSTVENVTFEPIKKYAPLLKDIEFDPNLKVVQSAELPWAVTPKVDRAMKNFDDYIKTKELNPVRASNVPKFEGPNERILTSMYEDLADRFGDAEFIKKEMAQLFSEYEYFVRNDIKIDYDLVGKGMSFEESWEKFLVHVAKKEGLGVTFLEDKFFSTEEFRTLVGKTILFDEKFAKSSHGRTTHAVQAIFVTRHFRQMGVPESHIDEFFAALGNPKYRFLWGEFFDSISKTFGSPEVVHDILMGTKFQSGRVF